VKGVMAMVNKTLNKPKILMHYVMPGATGGPNILFNRIENANLLKEKYHFVRLNQTRVAGGKLNLSLILELKEQIQRENPDIIHISGMQSAGFHCMIAAVLAGCKNRIITTHGFSGDALDISKIKRFFFNNIIEPITLIMATKVQGISEYTILKKMVKRFAKHKTTYIYNFPPNLNDSIKDTSTSIREELGINRDEVVYTSISRIVLDKGYKELAEAIHSLNAIKNIRFLIVGDGKYEDIFKKEVANEIKSGKVIMLGKRSDVMDILSESDVFVLPTLHENLGNVFLEASTVGIPSIGTNLGGVPEIIVHDKTGVLIPPYNSEALSNAILKLYNNPKLRMEMGKKANRRLNKIFSPVRIAKQFDNLYSSMLKKR
jgi:glycosyltransferase involved in cell wall biosynthesis